MASRVLRAAIAASLALALFVLARPARAASAPFCDDRGASAIAAPPVLEAPDDAIRRAGIVSCDSDMEERLLDASVGPAHRVPGRGPASAEPALASWRVHLPSPSGQLVPVPSARVAPPPEGVGFRVERPPRG
jgi:hypothetical protein